ncbi:MAG: hypothetical protein HY059_14545 [Proteobacteria bacterium]|nr:hypothetical protein [Pseudomonadota bacterium]
MRSIHFAIAASLALAASASGASAQSPAGPRMAPALGRVALTPHVGTDVTLDSSMTRSATARVSELALFNGIAFDGPGFLNIATRSFGDLYGKPLDLGFDMSYGVSDRGEIFGGMRFLHATGQKTAVGAFTVSGSVKAAAFEAGAALLAKPGNFASGTLEAGYRHFLTTQGPLLAYLSGSVGVTRTSSINADLSVRSAANGDLPAGNVKIYDSTFAPTAGLQVGVTYALAPQASFGVETGLRFDGALKGNDDDIRTNDSGLTAINDSSRRLSMPLRLTGRIAF